MKKPKISPKALASTPLPGFAYSRAFFESRVDASLQAAKKLGASDAAAEVSEGCGLSVSVRNGELENVERNRDKSLGVTVYLGKRRGNASTSDFSDAAIAQTVRAAYDIARFTAEDPFARLPAAKDICPVSQRERDLDLFHPWAVTSAEAAELALQCEGAALSVDKRITNSEGAAVSAQQSHFFTAHTNGFRGGYASSRRTTIAVRSTLRLHVVTLNGAGESLTNAGTLHIDLLANSEKTVHSNDRTRLVLGSDIGGGAEFLNDFAGLYTRFSEVTCNRLGYARCFARTERYLQGNVAIMGLGFHLRHTVV